MNPHEAHLPTSLDDALDRAGDALATAHENLMTRDPAAQARDAYRPGGPPVAVLEARIRALQAGISSDSPQPPG